MHFVFLLGCYKMLTSELYLQGYWSWKVICFMFFDVLLLLLWYLIPKVVKPPPHNHAGVEAVDGPRFSENQEVSEVAKNGVSLFSSKSRQHTFLGAGKWTVCKWTVLPSRACRKSAHAIIFRCQRKSLRKMISASSAPSQANDPVVGLQKVL